MEIYDSFIFPVCSSGLLLSINHVYISSDFTLLFLNSVNLRLPNFFKGDSIFITRGSIITREAFFTLETEVKHVHWRAKRIAVIYVFIK